MESQMPDGVFVESDGKVHEFNSLNIILVGDSLVGKTSILSTYLRNEFPRDHVSTVFENHPGKIIANGEEHNVLFWDCAGHDDFDKSRPLWLSSRVRCFILCFAVNDSSSFENVAAKWYPEIKEHCRTASIVLVGTKNDLRSSGEKCVSQNNATKMKKKIRAAKYVECSALNNSGLSTIFVEAVLAATTEPKSSCCKIV